MMKRSSEHRTIVKMCGMMRERDIEICNRLRPDLVGCILSPGFRRSINHEAAARFRTLLSPDIPLVGVFVDEAPETIASLVSDGTIDLVQLHGNESPEYIETLRQLIGSDTTVIRAAVVRDISDAEAAVNSPADLLLLDSGRGSGKGLDESLLSPVDRPFLLAGGLDPENVAGKIRKLLPYGVDVSSGIETDGQKDPAKMVCFLREVRDADHHR